SDKRRDRYFNAVLQAIDDKISKLNPAKSKMEELDVYMDHLEQISYLEMEIPLLIEKLENMSEGLFETELIFHQLLSLQDEIDNLYHDIRMPQEMIVRLQALRKLLKKTFSKFKNSSS
ncbi:MAG TPA: hypothetical protein PLC42_00620, partial [Parachlamydiaceae bacterium]|nr:hypothetical protein [Parachlamydiaceae bacterium]